MYVTLNTSIRKEKNFLFLFLFFFLFSPIFFILFFPFSSFLFVQELASYHLISILSIFKTLLFLLRLLLHFFFSWSGPLLPRSLRTSSFYVRVIFVSGPPPLSFWYCIIMYSIMSCMNVMYECHVYHIFFVSGRPQKWGRLQPGMRVLGELLPYWWRG